MKIANHLLIAGAATLLALTPAYGAGGSHGPGGSAHGSSSSAAGATSVPEPSDAVLLLIGAAAVVVGRRLHARKERRD